MVRFSWVWRAVFRMDHPQVRWSLQLMTQDGWNAEQVQEDYKGVGALPLNRGEYGKNHGGCHWHTRISCCPMTVCGRSCRCTSQRVEADPRGVGGRALQRWQPD